MYRVNNINHDIIDRIITPSRPTDSPAGSLLDQFRRLGIELEVVGEDLRFRAPRGALTPELKQQIVSLKPEIVALLQGEPGAPDEPRRAGPAPGPVDGRGDRPRKGADAPGRATSAPIPGPQVHSQNSQNSQDGLEPAGAGTSRAVFDPNLEGQIASHNSHYSQNSAATGPPGHSANIANNAKGSPGPEEPSGIGGPIPSSKGSSLAKDLAGPGIEVGPDRPDDPAGRTPRATGLSPGAGVADEPTGEPPLPPAGHAVVVLGSESFVYQKDWSGTPLVGGSIGLDTETARIEGHEIPALALASASSGQDHALIHPDRLAQFVFAHRDRHLVAFNAAFDFWVVAQHLERRGERAALECWWAIAEEGRLHDPMILDALVRLARSGAYPSLRDLGTVALEYGGLAVNKEDPYRLRYAEIIGRPWDQVEPGFFQYAVGDPIATKRADSILRPTAIELARSYGVSDETMARYGPLTEAIQVKAAIALAAITRRGVRLDLEQAARVQGALRQRLEQAVAQLRSCPAYASLFKLDRDGRLQMTAGGLPSLSRKQLQQILIRVADEIGDDEEDGAFEIPRTRTGAVSTATEEWADHAGQHPFLADWFAMAETTKLCQFFGGLQDEVVHPRYTTMVLTGRTSCSRPNIQQMPRKAGFREIFRPAPGHFLLAADYSFIELRALAAVCEARYGKATLADVIRAGRDPHAYTAAMLLGRDPDEFLALQHSDPKEFKDRRQQAKPLNFGIPGGLGAASLVTYARRTYNVVMTIEEAQEFRRRMITEVYPEWGQYLADDPMAILASSLGTTADACRAALDWKGDRSPGLVGAIRRIVRGELLRKDGQPYDPRFIAGVWNGLNLLNRSGALGPLIARRQGGPDLCRLLFDSGVATMTGWIRGRVSYAQCRNTPFQHLAAAGGKLALWRLMREGYRVIGFVHDEVLVELPDEGGYVGKEEVDRVVAIMCAEMEGVLGGNLPVACEATLSICWSKEARLDVRDGKVYPWSPGMTAGDPA